MRQVRMVGATAQQRRQMLELGADGDRRGTESSAQVRYRHLRRMEKREVAMRDIHDLMDNVLFVVIIVCGSLALIAMTSVFVVVMARTTIDVVTKGLNGI